MKIKIEDIKALELKLAEYSKANGTIAEHDSDNSNSYGSTSCGSCYGGCMYGCDGGCKDGCNATSYGH